MVVRSRKRRAAAEDIYRQCRPQGTCPEDVVNKIEGNTPADRFLKWISSFLYFGRLGIGTGSGAGGSGGYARLTPTITGGARLEPGGAVVRPSLAVEPIGPIPAEITPEAPSVVTLSDTTATVPDIPATSSGDLAPDIELANLPTSRTESGPSSDIGSEPAILDLHPSTTSTRTSNTHFHNPVYQAPFTSDVHIGESSSLLENVQVLASGGGDSIGAEYLPFRDLEPRATSTPEGPPPRARVRGDPRYLRRTQQVKVTDPRFISGPSQLIYFDNPIFDNSATLDLTDTTLPTTTPHPEFSDIFRLGHLQYGETASGHVRVNRLGTRGTMLTRSGLRIGTALHYYQDISSIAATVENSETIELSVLGESTGSSNIVQGDLSGYEVVDLQDPQPLYPDESLLDTYEDVASSGRLILTGSGGYRTTILVEPLFYTGLAESLGLNTADAGLLIHGGLTVDKEGDSTDTSPPIHPLTPPTILIDFQSSYGDFFLHPSLIPKKKRRLGLFTDEYVVTE
uniref:Minor capsid protein L2 n=1 Tax=Florida manatee papillomavirus TaxID=255363 RepID=Q52P63_9PAPI|nr:L2 capsid protein [Florida manatee papillomavirus]AAZ20322.1 L2 capsid protein [Florida manatee papillomavirus]